MSQQSDTAALVTALVDHAKQRLTTAATDAQSRQADLATAQKEAGNRIRSTDVKAAIEAENALATDARAVAKRTTQLKQSMTADLERLLTLALGSD